MKVTFHYSGSSKGLAQPSLPMPIKWLGWVCDFEKSKCGTFYSFNKCLLNTYCVSAPALWKHHSKKGVIFQDKVKSLFDVFSPAFKERFSLKHWVKSPLSRNSHEFSWDRRSGELTWFSPGFQTLGPQISCYNILPSPVRPTGVPRPWDRHQLSPFLSFRIPVTVLFPVARQPQWLWEEQLLPKGKKVSITKPQ